MGFWGRTVDETYMIAGKRNAFGEETKWGSTGFKREFRDASNQVIHATAVIGVAAYHPVTGPIGTHGREFFTGRGPADFRLNSEAGDIGLAFGTFASQASMGRRIREELGDPSQVEAYSGSEGGDPDD